MLPENVFTFVWQIENFDMHRQLYDPKSVLRSPAFKVDFLPETKWYLSLLQIADSKFKSCCLQAEDKFDGHLSVNFMFTALSMYREKHIRTEIVTRTFEGICDDGNQVKPIKFIDLNKVFNRENGFLPSNTLTIVCHMWKSNDNDFSDEDLNIEDAYVLPSTQISCRILKYSLKSNKFFSRTRIEVRSEFALWSIERFSELRPGVEVCKGIHLGTKKFDLIQLMLHLSIVSDADSSIRIEIHRKDQDDEDVRDDWPYHEDAYPDAIFVRGKLNTLGTPKDIQQEGNGEYYFDGAHGIWQFPNFMKRKDLTEGKYLSYTGDVLYICCDFSCFVDEVYNFKDGDFEFPVFCSESDDSCCCSDMVIDQQLYTEGMFSDAVLRAGTKEFKVQKSILCQKSDVFRAMFESEMREKASGIVDIPDIEPDVLDRMLSFIYTDKLESDLNHVDVSRLYLAADKYNIVSLKCRCCCVLMSIVSASTVCEILVFANMFHDVDLYEAARSFIHTNAKKVFYSQNWKDFALNNPRLAADIMQCIITNKLLD